MNNLADSFHRSMKNVILFFINQFFFTSQPVRKPVDQRSNRSCSTLPFPAREEQTTKTFPHRNKYLKKFERKARKAHKCWAAGRWKIGGPDGRDGPNGRKRLLLAPGGPQVPLVLHTPGTRT